MTDDSRLSAPLRRVLDEREPAHIACLAPGCCERPVNNCEFCPGHQRLINHMQLWLLDLPLGPTGHDVNVFGASFDIDRLLW